MGIQEELVEIVRLGSDLASEDASNEALKFVLLHHTTIQQNAEDAKRLRALERVMDEPRFFIDHTMIHDRVTGKHVTCDPDFRDYEINPGETTRINNPDGISNTCALLNNLAAHPARSGVVSDEDVAGACDVVIRERAECAHEGLAPRARLNREVRAALEHFAKGSNEDVRDAARWRYLVRENNKGGRGAFRIVWFDEPGDGFITTDGVSVDGKDEQAIVRIVDSAIQGERHDR